MSAEARPGPLAARAAPRARRFGLFPKYATALMLLVGVVLALSGSLQLALTYQESRESVAAIQRSEARVAAIRIEQVLASVQSHLVEVGSLPWSGNAMQLAERREEYRRLLRVVPAISELRLADRWARERLHLSRREPERIDSLADASGRDGFEAAAWRGVAFGKPYFRDAGSPHVTLAVRDKGPSGGVTLAELDLRFVADVVKRIHVGAKGLAYVVDSQGRVIAHPDAAVVPGRTDISLDAPFRELRERVRESADGLAGMMEADGLDGSPVRVSAAWIPTADWLVIVEQPEKEVLRPVYQALRTTGVLVAAGLLFALLISWFLARRLSRPILQVRKGAETIARGDLSARIQVRTDDEVEALANEFNRMAEQLQDYTTGLERRVTQKTAQLEAANRHKTEFLANMSHELRTPLNAVIGFSEVLRERMFGELNPKQMQYVRDIHGSGQHLLSLINDILDLAKIEAGRMELDVRPFRVAAALDNCRTLIRERAHRQGLRLDFEVAPELGEWPGDERKFKQVVVNLLSNAVKFTPAGGAVRLRAACEGGMLVVDVEDTGPGIAPEDHDAIFREFVQLRGGKQEGTGLGLALVRRLAELHGGGVSLASRPGRGSRFTVRFARVEPPADG